MTSHSDNGESEARAYLASDIADQFLPDGDVHTTIGAIRQAIAAARSYENKLARMIALREILESAAVVDDGKGMTVTLAISYDIYKEIMGG